MAQRRSKSTDRRPTTPEEVNACILNESLGAILDEIRGIRAGKIDTAPHDPMTRVAWLGQRATSMMAEQRKVEASRRKHTEGITRALVIAFARKLEPAERAQLVRDLQDIDARRSSLG